MKNIDTLHVFVTVKNGVESVMLYKERNGQQWPMIAGDADAARNFRGMAESTGKRKGVAVRHLVFTGREVVEEVCPEVPWE